MPEIVCTEDVRSSAKARLSAPRMSFAEALVNSGRPVMGRYSWFNVGSFRRISSAYVKKCKLQHQETDK